MCFLNLKPHKQIALHQIMFILATSYDPFNDWVRIELYCLFDANYIIRNITYVFLL